MPKIVVSIICLLCGLVMGCMKEPLEKKAVSVPVVTAKPKILASHGHAREDDYYWLRDDSRQDAEMLAYLYEENAYTEASLRASQALREKLYHELRARIKEDDTSVPYRLDDYWYYRRYQSGQEHPLYARRRHTMESPEELLLDVNHLAHGHEYYQIANVEVSPDHQLLAYAEDTVSRRLYTIRIKDLQKNTLYAEAIPDTSGDIAWSRDGRYLFYVKKHPQTLLPHQVYRHALGTDVAQDVKVYEEADDTFYTSVHSSRSKEYIFITLHSTLTTEVRFLDAAKPTEKFNVFLPREHGHEYDVEHLGVDFYVRSNWKADNFRLLKTRLAQRENKDRWQEVIPHRPDIYLAEFELFNDFLVLNERVDGLLKVRVKSHRGDKDFYIEPENDPAYAAEIDFNPSADTTLLRYAYSSLTTPDTVYAYDMHTGRQTLLKRQPVLGGFDPAHYQSERLWVSARDGVKVPVSLVYRKGFKRDGSHALFQYAYGSYGVSIDPEFRMDILSLLDRGFVFAIAHVRGGQELGRQWYEDGKLLKKKNTFTDFIDVTRFLVTEKYAAPDKVVARGGSAGGLLIGAVANMDGMRYRALIADVPFVDVVTTMLDESIPLTTGEYDEWGNPNEKTYYDYMLSYSPYDQIKAQAYPHLLVTSGLHDSQVQYWEPTKWVARLRALKTDHNLLLLHTNMEAGHGGASGRFKSLEEVAMRYAFTLQVLGIKE